MMLSCSRGCFISKYHDYVVLDTVAIIHIMDNASLLCWPVVKVIHNRRIYSNFTRRWDNGQPRHWIDILSFNLKIHIG